MSPGGEEGALKGPSIMPGGHREAYEAAGGILRDISAKVDGEPCCTYIGADGAGHYVKMVHNGIEYGDMQLISEAYFIMKNLLGMSYNKMSDLFSRWNKGDLDSFLIEITADILSRSDPETGQPMVEVILDRAGQKGTGKWTTQSALDLGVAAPTVAEAVFARCISSMKDERVAASRLIHGPTERFSGDINEFATAVHDALYASKICSYAQGFSILAAAAAEQKWSLNFGEIAMIWRGGCIIRAKFLSRIKQAYDRDPALPNLLLDPYFRQTVENAQRKWRRVVAAAATYGVPVPAFSSALSYFDSYRSERLPANLIPGPEGLLRGSHLREDRQAGNIPYRLDRSMIGLGDAGTVVESSVAVEDSVTYALLNREDGRRLAILGPRGCTRGFDVQRVRASEGRELSVGGITHANAESLRRVLPFTAPRPLGKMALTIGLGDRLGLAGAGHISAIRGFQAWPVLAQQSMRELTLTVRTYADVIDASTWAVFAAGYREPWGADGDHLKTEDQVRDARAMGCSMITADISDHLHGHFEDRSDAEIEAAWLQVPEASREELQARYLSRSFSLSSGEAVSFTASQLRRIVLLYGDGLVQAERLYRAGMDQAGQGHSTSSSPSMRPRHRHLPRPTSSWRKRCEGGES